MCSGIRCSLGHAVDFRLAMSGAVRIHWSANPQFSPMSLFGDLLQSPHGNFHLALATGPTCYSKCVPHTVLHGAVYCGTWVAPARCQLSRIPLCLGKAKSEQLRVEWGPTKPNSHPLQDAYSHRVCHSQEAGKQPQIGQMSLAAVKKRAPAANNSRQAQWIPFRVGGGAI